MRETCLVARLLLIAASACGGDAPSSTDGAGTDPAGSTTHIGTTSATDTSVGDTTSSPTDGSSSNPVALDLPPGQDCAPYAVVLDGGIFDDNEELLALQGVECVPGTILVRMDVTDLTPLSSLRATGDLLFEAPLLSSLAGLEQLAEIHNKFVLGPHLPDRGCVGTQVSTLAPLMSLQRIGELQICDNQFLTSLVELDAALDGDFPGRISVSSSPNLVSLAGFEGLTSVELQFGLTGLPLVESLGPLADLERVEGAFTLAGLDGLTSMEGLEALTYANSLLIVENAGLLSLAGLENVMAIADNLSIRDNPLLPQAEAEAWAAQVDVAGVVTICGNLDGPPC